MLLCIADPFKSTNNAYIRVIRKSLHFIELRYMLFNNCIAVSWCDGMACRNHFNAVVNHSPAALPAVG